MRSAITFVLAIAILGLLLFLFQEPWFTSEIFRVVGSRNEPGAWYGFWSGFGGSVPDIALISGAGAWYLHHTCHDHPMCLRWGKYPAAGSMFYLCHKHHPDLDGKKPTRDKIKELHNA